MVTIVLVPAAVLKIAVPFELGTPALLQLPPLPPLLQLLLALPPLQVVPCAKLRTSSSELTTDNVGTRTPKLPLVTVMPEKLSMMPPLAVSTTYVSDVVYVPAFAVILKVPSSVAVPLTVTLLVLLLPVAAFTEIA